MRQFYSNVKIVPGKTPEAAITNATANYPAAGVDVRGYEFVDVLVHVGALDSALTAQLMCNTAATGGTLDAVDVTYAKNTVGATDDGQLFLFNLEVAKLPKDHFYLTCQLKGATGNDYADVLFFLHNGKPTPVTQVSASLPAENVKTYAG